VSHILLVNVDQDHYFLNVLGKDTQGSAVNTASSYGIEGGGIQS